MKNLLAGLLSGLVLLLAAGCATPADRIAKDQAAFDKFPPQAQEKIRAGQIDIGFTYTMVQMALGAPDHTFSRTTPQGASEVWVYVSNTPHISVGVGVGSSSGSHGGGGTSTAVGVGVSNDSYGPDEKMRVVFMGGVVNGIEVRH